MTIRANASFRVLGTLLVSWLAVGCGGSVSGVAVGDDGGPGDDSTDAAPDPRCPAPSKIAGGAACSVSGISCPESAAFTGCDGTSRPLTCFCDGVSWTCEHDVSPPCMQTCPTASSIKNGGPCSAEGEQCQSTNVAVGNCNGGIGSGTGTGYCSCSNGAWSCPIIEPPCVAPTCPDPSKLIPGDKCAVPSTLVCNTNNLVVGGCPGELMAPTTASCSCYSGTWSCEQAIPTCGPVPCPSATSVWAYGPCSTSPDMTCSGNPQVCGSSTYYDAFRCNSGYWQQLTTTTCDLYGYPDASIYDAAVVSYDAGTYDDAF
jgi:hypothetical protein